MSNHSTTIRMTTERTIEDECAPFASLSATKPVIDYWQQQSDANVLRTLEAFPSLVENKSLLIDLIVREYKLKRLKHSVPLDEFCGQFRHLSHTIEKSIFRALEVQEYLDDHPELLELVAEFEWPRAGDCLHSFQIVEELGRGALARVYLCRESDLGQREVVLKVARGCGYEAELLGRLDHPNIVPVYSVTNDAERYVSHICMPFRGRSTLQDVVDRLHDQGIPKYASAILQAARVWGAPNCDCNDAQSTIAGPDRGSYVDGVLRLAIQLSGALAHAHGAGIYHGDLKPSNVLLTTDGRPLLIDFNLAADWRTGVGPRGGTLAYMPPEQLGEVSGRQQSNRPKYDARSEVYSFGALIYQLLTAQIPFPADAAAVNPRDEASRLIAIQRTHQPEIRSKNHIVNAELARLILECLAFDPDKRPQSMSELRERLERQYRPIARIRRRTHARPVLTKCLMVAASAVLIFTSSYLLLRPSFHSRQLSRGLELQQRGDYQAAIVRFNQAIEGKQERQEAMYQRARTYLLQGDFANAMADFSHVSEEFFDARSAACVGYCFNLMGNMSSAIPWYERALKGGLETAGVHNNLGVCYAKGRSEAGRLERLAKAQYHLEKAMAIDKTSLAIRGNLVTVVLLRCDEDPSFNPKDTVKQLGFLLQAIPQNPKVIVASVQLYSVLSLNDHKYVDKALSAIDLSLKKGYGPTARELRANPRFNELRHDSRFANLQNAASTSAIHFDENLLASLIDPVDGEGHVIPTR